MKGSFVNLMLLLLIAYTAPAQTEKGRWTIGAQLGSLSYQKQKNGYRALTAGITPWAGYFVANGLAVGTGLPLSLSSVKYGNLLANFYELRQNGVSIGLSPFVRYYLGNAKLKPFLGMSYRYSQTRSKYKTDTAGGSESKTRGHTTALVPTAGLTYFVSRTLGLALNIDYNIDHIEYDTVETSPYTPGPSMAKYDTRSLSVGVGFQLFIGQ